jgi:uncharacterized RmlC-like cupin family protein
MAASCVHVRAGEEGKGSTGVTYAEGISALTAGSQHLCLELATLPPGAVGRAHLHAGHESAAYVVEGSVVLLFGEQLKEKVVAHAGDFLYIPSGVPHLPANASASEPAVTVLARTDADAQESVTLLPELDDLPHLREAVGQ